MRRDRDEFNGAPTESDWGRFHSMSVEDKSNIMYLYLTGKCRDMKSIAQDLGYEDSGGWVASTVLRCYGLTGKNAGRYKNYGLDIEDFKEIVRCHPDGVKLYDKGEELDSWIRALIDKKKRYDTEINNSPVKDIISKPISSPYTPSGKTERYNEPANITLLTIIFIACVVFIFVFGIKILSKIGVNIFFSIIICLVVSIVSMYGIRFIARYFDWI